MDQMVVIDLHAEENVSAGRTSVSRRNMGSTLQYDARGTPHFSLMRSSDYRSVENFDCRAELFQPGCFRLWLIRNHHQSSAEEWLQQLAQSQPGSMQSRLDDRGCNLQQFG